MSGSDDGRGNSEEREGGPPARVLPGGQIVQPGQVDRLRDIERKGLERMKLGVWDDGTIAGVYMPEAKIGERPDLSVVEYVRADIHAGGVSSWPSARNVIEAVREGQLGLDALREVVTILDIHLGGQS